MSDLQQQYLHMIVDQDAKELHEEALSNIDSFIVRISRDQADTSGSLTRWHGSIEKVGQEQRLYIRDLGAILRFIEEQSHIPPTNLKTRLRRVWQRIWHG